MADSAATSVDTGWSPPTSLLASIAAFARDRRPPACVPPFPSHDFGRLSVGVHTKTLFRLPSSIPESWGTTSLATTDLHLLVLDGDPASGGSADEHTWTVRSTWGPLRAAHLRPSKLADALTKIQCGCWQFQRPVIERRGWRTDDVRGFLLKTLPGAGSGRDSPEWCTREPLCDRVGGIALAIAVSVLQASLRDRHRPRSAVMAWRKAGPRPADSLTHTADRSNFPAWAKGGLVFPGGDPAAPVPAVPFRSSSPPVHVSLHTSYSSASCYATSNMIIIPLSFGLLNCMHDCGRLIAILALFFAGSGYYMPAWKDAADGSVYTHQASNIEFSGFCDIRFVCPLNGCGEARYMSSLDADKETPGHTMSFTPSDYFPYGMQQAKLGRVSVANCITTGPIPGGVSGGEAINAEGGMPLVICNSTPDDGSPPTFWWITLSGLLATHEGPSGTPIMLHDLLSVAGALERVLPLRGHLDHAMELLRLRCQAWCPLELARTASPVRPTASRSAQLVDFRGARVGGVSSRTAEDGFEFPGTDPNTVALFLFGLVDFQDHISWVPFWGNSHMEGPAVSMTAALAHAVTAGVIGLSGSDIESSMRSDWSGAALAGDLDGRRYLPGAPMPAEMQLQLDVTAFITNGGSFTHSASGVPSLFLLRLPSSGYAACDRDGWAAMFPRMMTQIPLVVGPTAWALGLGSRRRFWETMLPPPPPRKLPPGIKLGRFAGSFKDEQGPPGTPLARRRNAGDPEACLLGVRGGEGLGNVMALRVTVAALQRCETAVSACAIVDSVYSGGGSEGTASTICSAPVLSPLYDPLMLHDTSLMALLSIEGADATGGAVGGDAMVDAGGSVIRGFDDSPLVSAQLLVWEPAIVQFDDSHPSAAACLQLPVAHTWCRRAVVDSSGAWTLTYPFTPGSPWRPGNIIVPELHSRLGSSGAALLERSSDGLSTLPSVGPAGVAAPFGRALERPSSQFSTMECAVMKSWDLSASPSDFYLARLFHRAEASSEPGPGHFAAAAARSV